MNPHPILIVENLSVSFRRNGIKHSAISGISFELLKGESLAIVGESGSGKSVTAKSLIGLNPTESASVDAGTITYNGIDLLSLNETEIRRYRGKEIGMIFQDPMASLNPTMKIGKQVQESYLQHHIGASKKEAKKQTLRILELVGLPDPIKQYHSYPHELSGGMRQRVMIAITLIAEPKILIADEPTTALDVTIQAQILDLLKKIQMEIDTSIIFITHDLSIVAGFCSKILVMYQGIIVESASTLDIFENPQHFYTQKLLQSIQKLDKEEQEQMASIR